MKIIIIIPTFNEVDNISDIVNLIFTQNKNIDILIIDDNSPDGTSDKVKSLQKKEPRLHLITRETKLGLGSAYRAGFSWALKEGYDAILQMDADFSHNPKYISSMVKSLKTADVVVGSRYVRGGDIVANWGYFRKCISIIANHIARFILKLKTLDTTSGFKCFKRTALEKIPFSSINSDGYSFQIEMARLCEKNKLIIYEMPILFLKRRDGQSKLSWKEVVDAIIAVFSLMSSK